MSENDTRCSPMQYVVENATDLRVLNFITYFDCDNEKDAKAKLKTALDNSLTLSKIKKNLKKADYIKNLKENIDEEFGKDNIQDFFKYKAIKANLRSNAFNFHVMSSAALSSVSNEILSTKKREGGSVGMVTKERKKTKTTTEIYMQGGQGPYVFTHKSVVWSYKSSNISLDLNNFRNRCMNRNFNRELSFVEQIALNGVYYINESANENYYGIDEDTWSELVEETMGEFARFEGTVDNISNFDNIIKSFKKTPKKAITLASAWFSQCEEESNDYFVSKALLDVLCNLKRHNTFELKEPLYQSLFIEPILSPYIAFHKKHVLKGSSDESIGSRERKGDSGRIPDLALNVEHTSYSQSVFVCEIKSAVYMQKHPYSHPDKVKLINLMKDELDLVQNKYAANGDVIVYGALVEGHRVRLYAMDLKYSAIYRLFKLDELFIPRSCYDVDVLRNSLLSLLMLKNGIKESSNHCVQIFKLLNEYPPVTPRIKLPLSLVSFKSPQRK